MTTRLEFTVGERERHEVVYTWDQFWGRLRITVDGASVVKTVRMFSFKLAAAQDLTVGTTEKHQVRIVKERPVAFAAFRPQQITASVDGRVVAQTQATMRRGQTVGIGIAVCVLLVAGVALQFVH